MKGTLELLQFILPPPRSRNAIIPLAVLLVLAAWSATADQYRGNGNTGFGGAVGNGTLTLRDDGTNISGTLTVGGSMNDVLVLYIQSGTGGFADTSGFNDQSDSCRQAISGVSASGRSLLTFASGFQPNYAIALAPAAAGTGGLWQLANGGNNSLVYLGSVNLTPLNNSGPYTFSFPAALIGMIPGVRSTIQVFGTYVRADGSRSTEAIAGNLAGAQGWNPFTQTAYANYTFDAGSVLVKLPLGVWTQHASGVPPAARAWHTAVWTGAEMIVWGGYGNNGYLNDGGRYNPAANSWTALPSNGAPAARWFHTAVWTGSELMVWGGQGSSGYLNDGGRYNPVTDSWTALPTNGAPAARWCHTAVWAGSEMIIWGGTYFSGDFGYPCNDGGRYDPVANSWTMVPTNGAPAVRAEHTAVWTGSEMIIWGGGLNDGGRYNPTANSWTALPATGAPAARYDHTAVWTGSEMIIWGGAKGTSWFFNDGGRYNPAANVWTALPTNGAPAARSYHTAVWTGGEMIVWGGEGSIPPFYRNDGGRYNPTANSWTGVPNNGAPVARIRHTAMWTGSKMILFGGFPDGGICLSDTWSYYPYGPAVRISRSGSTGAEVAGPVWHPTLRLCQAPNLAAGQWTTVTNTVTQVGAENHVTVLPLSGRQFFRAVYP
jgi:N-acetylneuraminic acid mutarotase